MDGFELKLAYVNYKCGHLGESVRLLEKFVSKYLYNDLKIDQDPFWKIFAKQVFVANVMHQFYLENEVTNDNVLSLFNNFETVKNAIKEFCVFFGNEKDTAFASYLKCVTDKMVESARTIIIEHLCKDYNK
jgi:outer membrane protein assembly factor BamD (BamD/ComL family)